MRALIGLSILLCGCDLLPKKTLLCRDFSGCESQVSAPFVIGQPDDKSNSYTAAFYLPSAVAITASGTLVVSDRGTARLLIWRQFPTRSYQPADFAIGSVNHSLPGSTLLSIGEISVREGQLIAGSPASLPSLNIWSPFPTQHGPPTASWTVASAIGLQGFRGVGPLLVGGQYYQNDDGNNRLLLWDSVPTTPMPISSYIGQSDAMTATANGISAGTPSSRSLYAPAGSPATDGKQLLIADAGNHRVLIWSTLPTDNTQPATWVLGQASLDTGFANRNQASPDLNTLRAPSAVAIGGGRIAVADSGNHRVLLWNGPISENGVAADVVLGQAGRSAMLPNSGGVSGARMNGPKGVATDGTRVVVADSDNHRVLIWNTWPTGSGAPADLILGQTGEEGNLPLGSRTSASSFAGPVVAINSVAPAGPTAVAGSRKGFLIADSAAHRVLVYAAPPLSPSERPVAVLGQPDFVSSYANQTAPGVTTSARSAGTLFSPLAVSMEDETVAVADTSNHRVLIWRRLPSKNGQPADLILGQSAPGDGMPNAGGTTAGLNRPCGVALAGGRLYVADTDNNRVLIWNRIPDGPQPADVVLGQVDLSSTYPNRCMASFCGLDGGTLNKPLSVTVSDSEIFVADSGSARILRWNTLAPSSGQAADAVLGRPLIAENGTINLDADLRLYNPTALSWFQNRLFVVDANAHRVVYFDTRNRESGARPIGVLGQPDLFSIVPNAGGVSAERLYNPTGVAALPDGIYLSETGNNRVLALPPMPPL